MGYAMRLLFVIIYGLSGLFCSTSVFGSTELEQVLFPAGFEEKCRVIDRSLEKKLNAVDSSILQITKKLTTSIESKNIDALVGLFHKRLKTTTGSIRLLFKKIGVMYGWPINLAAYRLWAVNSNKSSDLVACKSDNLAIGPHYGYPIQFGLWLQLLGQRELGRIYVSIVQQKSGDWKLGALHLQQWTHKEIDAKGWVEQALAERESGAVLSPYIKLDLAKKLLNGGGYIYPAFVQDIVKTQNALVKEKDFHLFLKKKFDLKNLVDATSLFATDGAGLSLRLLVKINMKSSVLISNCEEAITKIYKNIKSTNLAGVRCGYVVEGENYKADGHLGSRFISKEKILKLLEKKS